MRLSEILQQHAPRDISRYSDSISDLKSTLQSWAGEWHEGTYHSGSAAKGTAISISSDFDFLISLKSGCYEDQGGLKTIYEKLYKRLLRSYQNVKKQNVSCRIYLPADSSSDPPVEVDITPARRHAGSTSDHSLWSSKLNTWKQTNIQRHINDVANSGRTDEIKLLKIWREKNLIDLVVFTKLCQ